MIAIKILYKDSALGSLVERQVYNFVIHYVMHYITKILGNYIIKKLYCTALRLGHIISLR